ncbi:hypothetical protein GZH53_06290 [Flavihumibacter sp. R14]|nr:hypothetical protein [Flavihumibacter soli]
MKVELSHANDKIEKSVIDVNSLEDLLRICKKFDRDIIISLPMQNTKSRFDFYVMVYDDSIE